jgi:GNAT superfamily N-acetyltransferase
MPVRIHIREANTHDAKALAGLATQLGYPSQPEETLQRLRSVKTETCCVFAAVADADVVGWVHVSLYPVLQADDAAQILGLVVDQEWRGQGIGGALLKAAEAWAAERGCRTLYVRSNITRKDAHSFYQHLGYQLVKTSVTFTKSLDTAE